MQYYLGHFQLFHIIESLWIVPVPRLQIFISEWDCEWSCLHPSITGKCVDYYQLYYILLECHIKKARRISALWTTLVFSSVMDTSLVTSQLGKYKVHAWSTTFEFATLRALTTGKHYIYSEFQISCWRTQYSTLKLIRIAGTLVILIGWFKSTNQKCWNLPFRKFDCLFLNNQPELHYMYCHCRIKSAVPTTQYLPCLQTSWRDSGCFG